LKLEAAHAAAVKIFVRSALGTGLSANDRGLQRFKIISRTPDATGPDFTSSRSIGMFSPANSNYFGYSPEPPDARSTLHPPQ
jgi:hypothetical protein